MPSGPVQRLLGRRASSLPTSLSWSSLKENVALILEGPSYSDGWGSDEQCLMNVLLSTSTFSSLVFASVFCRVVLFCKGGMLDGVCDKPKSFYAVFHHFVGGHLKSVRI